MWRRKLLFPLTFAFGVDKFVHTNQSCWEFRKSLFQNIDTWLKWSVNHGFPLSFKILRFRMILSHFSGFSPILRQKWKPAYFLWASVTLCQGFSRCGPGASRTSIIREMVGDSNLWHWPRLTASETVGGDLGVCWSVLLPTRGKRSFQKFCRSFVKHSNHPKISSIKL